MSSDPCSHDDEWKSCTHPDCVARVLEPGEVPSKPSHCGICDGTRKIQGGEGPHGEIEWLECECTWDNSQQCEQCKHGADFCIGRYTTGKCSGSQVSPLCTVTPCCRADRDASQCGYMYMTAFPKVTEETMMKIDLVALKAAEKQVIETAKAVAKQANRVFTEKETTAEEIRHGISEALVPLMFAVGELRRQRHEV